MYRTSGLALLLSFVCQTALANLASYSETCSELMGSLPPFDCTAGTPLPVTVAGTAVTDSVPATCDKPNLLGSAECVPHSTIVALDTGVSGVHSVAICRRYFLRPASDPLFDDIAVIQHDTATGATCFFQSRNPGLVSHDSSRVPPPDEQNTPTGAPTPTEFWWSPSQTSGGSCNHCHNNDPFIHTPYVDQAGVVPFLDAQNGKYTYVGEALGNWMQPRKLDLPQNSCTSCHRIGYPVSDTVGTCGHLFRQSTGGETNPYLFGGASWPASHWMPHPMPIGIASTAAWDAQFGADRDAVAACCSDPSTCTWVETAYDVEADLEPRDLWVAAYGHDVDAPIDIVNNGPTRAPASDARFRLHDTFGILVDELTIPVSSRGVGAGMFVANLNVPAGQQLGPYPNVEVTTDVNDVVDDPVFANDTRAISVRQPNLSVLLSAPAYAPLPPAPLTSVTVAVSYTVYNSGSTPAAPFEHDVSIVSGGSGDLSSIAPEEDALYFGDQLVRNASLTFEDDGVVLPACNGHTGREYQIVAEVDASGALLESVKADNVDAQRLVVTDDLPPSVQIVAPPPQHFVVSSPWEVVQFDVHTNASDPDGDPISFEWSSDAKLYSGGVVPFGANGSSVHVSFEASKLTWGLFCVAPGSSVTFDFEVGVVADDCMLEHTDSITVPVTLEMAAGDPLQNMLLQQDCQELWNGGPDGLMAFMNMSPINPPVPPYLVLDGLCGAIRGHPEGRGPCDGLEELRRLAQEWASRRPSPSRVAAIAERLRLMLAAIGAIRVDRNLLIHADTELESIGRGGRDSGLLTAAALEYAITSVHADVYPSVVGHRGVAVAGSWGADFSFLSERIARDGEIGLRASVIEVALPRSYVQVPELPAMRVLSPPSLGRNATVLVRSSQPVHIFGVDRRGRVVDLTVGYDSMRGQATAVLDDSIHTLVVGR